MTCYGRIMKYVITIALALLVYFLADRLVRVENQRYAMLLNMCESKVPMDPLHWDFKCLDRVQTRTSWFWHLFYAVTDRNLPAVPL